MLLSLYHGEPTLGPASNCVLQLVDVLFGMVTAAWLVNALGPGHCVLAEVFALARRGAFAFSLRGETAPALA
jgi:hypothetical protein